MMRMMRKGVLIASLVALACLMLIPAAALAQSSIAGVVKDTMGAVLPGVTVEAASPAVSPANYDPFCVSAPLDTRLPGGGDQICGLYDINLSRFGQVSNLVTFARNFGTRTSTGTASISPSTRGSRVARRYLGVPAPGGRCSTTAT